MRFNGLCVRILENELVIPQFDPREVLLYCAIFAVCRPLHRIAKEPLTKKLPLQCLQTSVEMIVNNLLAFTLVELNPGNLLLFSSMLALFCLSLN